MSSWIISFFNLTYITQYGYEYALDSIFWGSILIISAYLMEDLTNKYYQKKILVPLLEEENSVDINSPGSPHRTKRRTLFYKFLNFAK